MIHILMECHVSQPSWCSKAASNFEEWNLLCTPINPSTIKTLHFWLQTNTIFLIWTEHIFLCRWHNRETDWRGHVVTWAQRENQFCSLEEASTSDQKANSPLSGRHGQVRLLCKWVSLLVPQPAIYLRKAWLNLYFTHDKYLTL